MPLRDAKRTPRFTLVELMMVIAIVAMITALVGGCPGADTDTDTDMDTDADTDAEPVPPPGAPSDGDYDHVVTLTGTQTGSSVVSTINALGAGTVLIRPLNESGATITGGMNIPRSDVTLYGLDLTGSFTFADGTVMWGVTASPANFTAGGADDWHIRDSLWSGGAGETRANGCVGNVYGQNWLSGTSTNPASNWIIEDSTFQNYAPTESGCGSDHTEAFFVGARSTQGVIRNNVFTNNGNTSHIFLTWWGSGCSSYAPACSPDDICIEGNAFGPTWTAYHDFNAREELPSSLNISVDPAQGASFALHVPTEWIRACP